MTTTERNYASEWLRGAVNSAIFTLTANHPGTIIELKWALDNLKKCRVEQEANELLMEEVLEALERASAATPLIKQVVSAG